MPGKDKIPTITVGDLKEHLALYTDDWEISFAGGLEFYRLKVRGEMMVNMEFNEKVYRDGDGEWQVEGE